MSDNEQEEQSRLNASVERLRGEFDHWLEAVVSQGGKTLDRFGLRGVGQSFVPAVDVIESAETIEVLIDLPGVDPQSVNLSLVGNMLTIEAEKPEFEANDSQTVHTRERLGGTFSRSIPMPAAVDPEKVTAEAIDAHGTLRVELTKAERAIRRQIQVRTPSS
ncbi:MAG: Hsp20/alpha crystallin family protein [Planctomycetaceae bacterium]|jgi:HSP20 family protein|nr:Hsp20/alpha crystallin family protein [Planctomycetaceae bacterium]MBT6487216.1 Hsp20/alpha crystallin family protein [Planctomycetaceae bacterium]MBT6495160.1 Hsp20/alpha crystallin family protein [Planctomycetaceae bacterium]